MNSYDKVLPMNTQPTHNDYKLPSSVASKFLNKLVYLEKLAEARRGAQCSSPSLRLVKERDFTW